jgi:hypothetical protein
METAGGHAGNIEGFVGKSTYPHHGQRVVAGQRLMQAATDIFLGWVRIKGSDGLTKDYYVRQFHDWKGGADVDTMLVPGATLYARICGATLARGPRPLGRPHRDRLLSGQGRCFRPRDRELLRGLRRPERTGLRGIRRGRVIWPPAARTGV